MNPSAIVEKWDGCLYTLYNLCQSIIYPFKKPHFLKKNLELKDKFKGQRCFVVMNGPSIKGLDLSKLESEVVFCSNYFYRSDLAEIVNPNFYCWADGKMFGSPERGQIVNEIIEKCKNARLLFNYKSYSFIGNKEYINYIYCKHIPNVFSVRNSLHGISSNFSTVAFHAINAALYMGFDNIYILGLDFPPGAFTHFADLGKGSYCDNPVEKLNKVEVCGNYWQYTKAHYESFYLQNFAKKSNQHIINLNPDSFVRAFEFGDYNSLF